jgi:hypothetical protein
VSAAFISFSVTLGFGRSFWDFNFRNLSQFLLFTNLAGTFSILAALWSKTSFAITVLRISAGWTRLAVWFIIISVNVSLGLAIAFTWAQCTPVEKTWRPGIPGTCWPKQVVIRYNEFTASMCTMSNFVLCFFFSFLFFFFFLFLPWSDNLTWSCSLLRRDGYCPSPAALEDHLGPDDEQEGKVRRPLCHEHGRVVSLPLSLYEVARSPTNLKNSAGVTSMVKVTQLPAIGFANLTDSTRQLVILGVAEGAITIMAASTPILRALLRDAPRPPPGPAQFYHLMDPDGLYMGTMDSRGTGRSSTVITSSGNSTRLSKDIEAGFGLGGTAGPAGGFGLTLKRISRLSRLSGLSFRGLGESMSEGGGKKGSVELARPPPGKIVTTEEVVVEYETNQYLNIGRAI